MSLAATYEDGVLDHLLGTTELTFDATIFIALGSDDATDKSTFTEVTTAGTNGYARQAIAFDAASGGSAANSDLITFGPCSSVAWDDVKSWALFSAVTGGTRLHQDVLVDQTKVVGVGDSYELTEGSVVVAVS